MVQYENLNTLNRTFANDFRGVLDEILESGTFILDKQVRGFEKEFANYCGSGFCVGVGNGTDALTLALHAFDFKEGSEVLVPANTYIASILAILNSHLKPVLVEPDRETCNLDPSRVEDLITKKTVAIMAVHLYGKCCPMNEILSICRKFDLKLIEDCAHAHGARFEGRCAGTFGDYGAFSFYPTKNLGALGDGGCLLTSNEELSHRIALLRNYGAIEKNRNIVVGFNSRLDELQAAFLRIKLQSLEKMNSQRRKLARLYDAKLSDTFKKPLLENDSEDAHYIYNVRHNQRDRVREHLAFHGIETMIHYPTPPYRQEALKGLFQGEHYPISDEIHATTISLPISPIHSESEIGEVIDVLNRFTG